MPCYVLVFSLSERVPSCQPEPLFGRPRDSQGSFPASLGSLGNGSERTLELLLFLNIQAPWILLVLFWLFKSSSSSLSFSPLRSLGFMGDSKELGVFSVLTSLPFWED